MFTTADGNLTAVGTLYQTVYTGAIRLYAISVVGLLIWPLLKRLRSPRKLKFLSRHKLSTQPLEQRYQNRKSQPLIWLVLWGLLPIAAIFGLAQLFPFLWLERYAVVAMPYVLILLAASWQSLWNSRLRRVAIALGLLYFVAVSGPLWRYYSADYHADWRGLAQAIARYEQPADTVAIYPGSLLPYIDHYYTGSAELTALPNTEEPRALSPADLAQTLQTLPLPNARLWVVCPTQAPWDDVQSDLFAQLTSDFNHQRSSQWLNHWGWGPTLHLFSRR